MLNSRSFTNFFLFFFYRFYECFKPNIPSSVYQLNNWNGGFQRLFRRQHDGAAFFKAPSGAKTLI